MKFYRDERMAPGSENELTMGNIDIRFYCSIFFRRFHYFMIIATLVSAAGLAVAFNLPRVYRAEARILVESPQISTALARSTVSAETVKQLRLIELQMLTRDNLLKLTEKFGLYKAQKQLSLDEIVADMRQKTGVDPIQLETQRPGDEVTAFSVSFKAQDPVIAADVVNEFVALILQRNVRLRTEQAGETLLFFQQEVERLGTKLNEVESQILKFKNDNKDALPESLSFRRSQYVSQQERLFQLEREEATLQDTRARLLQVFATGRSDNPSALSSKEQTLQQFRRLLVEQRAIFSDSSPSISLIQSQIATLEQDVQSERSRWADMSVSKERPVELEMQLAELARRLTLSSQEKASITHNLEGLTRSISATLGNETTLNALERQYQTIQTQYNLANARLSDASAGQQIELRSKGERLSLLEAAIPPERPIGPKRRLIAAAAVAAGLVLGIGFVVLLEVLNKRVRRPNELVDLLEIQPIVTIPYIQTGQKARPGVATLVPLVIVILGAVSGLAYALHNHESSLQLLFNHLMDRLEPQRML